MLRMILIMSGVGTALVGMLVILFDYLSGARCLATGARNGDRPQVSQWGMK